uniref:N/A n=1 Tax=Ganoderma boninense TaxID=34458 RepID=A0A5K1JZ54_9APHY|nr:N/A [Ganoderma boninense]
MTEHADDSQLDGLPRQWPHEGIDSQRAPAPIASLDTSPAAETTSHAGLPPIVTAKKADSPPQDAAVVASPEVLNQPLPEEPQPPEHTDNPDDLKEHLATIAPISSKRTTSAALEDPGIKDLGWRDDAARPFQLIRGVDNESVFTLIRRFDKTQ